MNINTFYNENNLETVKKMPDNFLDLVVTSPPYNLGISKKGSFYKRIDQEVIGKEGYDTKGSGKRKGDTYGNDTERLIRPQKDNTRCPLSIINFPCKKDKRHPTAKPIPLLKWLIERYSNEGDTILDPTAGSFNSGRASIELNRKYIGIEMDKCFYDKNHINE